MSKQKTIAYAIVDKRGKIVSGNARLYVYNLKRDAEWNAEEDGESVVKVEIKVLK